MGRDSDSSSGWDSSDASSSEASSGWESEDSFSHADESSSDWESEDELQAFKLLGIKGPSAAAAAAAPEEAAAGEGPRAKLRRRMRSGAGSLDEGVEEGEEEEWLGDTAAPSGRSRRRRAGGRGASSKQPELGESDEGMEEGSPRTIQAWRDAASPGLEEEEAAEEEGEEGPAILIRDPPNPDVLPAWASKEEGDFLVLAACRPGNEKSGRTVLAFVPAPPAPAAGGSKRKAGDGARWDVAVQQATLVVLPFCAATKGAGEGGSGGSGSSGSSPAGGLDVDATRQAIQGAIRQHTGEPEGRADFVFVLDKEDAAKYADIMRGDHLFPGPKTGHAQAAVAAVKLKAKELLAPLATLQVVEFVPNGIPGRVLRYDPSVTSNKEGREERQQRAQQIFPSVTKAGDDDASQALLLLAYALGYKVPGQGRGRRRRRERPQGESAMKVPAWVLERCPTLITDHEAVMAAARAPATGPLPPDPGPQVPKEVLEHNKAVLKGYREGAAKAMAAARQGWQAQRSQAGAAGQRAAPPAGRSS